MQGLNDFNHILKEMKHLHPTIQLPKLTVSEDLRKFRHGNIWTFSDASYIIATGRDYEQTGIVIGLRVRTTDGAEAVYLIYWASTQKRRVSHSSYGAEILACSDSDEHGFYLKQRHSGLRARFSDTYYT